MMTESSLVDYVSSIRNHIQVLVNQRFRCYQGMHIHEDPIVKYFTSLGYSFTSTCVNNQKGAFETVGCSHLLKNLIIDSEIPSPIPGLVAQNSSSHLTSSSLMSVLISAQITISISPTHPRSKCPDSHHLYFDKPGSKYHLLLPCFCPSAEPSTQPPTNSAG